MADLDTIIDVSVSANTTTPTRPGFGTPLFIGYHTKYSDIVRTYTKASELIDDGFATTDALYRMAASCFSAKPRPQRIKVGRLTTSVVQTMVVTITDATEGNHIKLTVTSPDGTETAIDYTILAGASTTTVAAAVELLIESCAGISSSAAVAEITVTAVSGATFYITEMTGCYLLDSTGDANIAVDLAAIQVEDNDWFGVACVIESHANADDIAAWCETNRKLYVAHSADYAEIAGTGAMGEGWKNAAYDFTVGIWSRDTPAYPAAAWLGRMLPTDPGAADWIYKTLRGVTADSLTSSQQTALEADNWSYYNTVGSRNITQVALVASGEKIDIIVGTEWLRSEIQLAVWDLLSAAEKIPYTDAGVAQVTSVIMGVLQQGVERNFLDGGDPDNDIDPPSVTAPRVADVATADRANRLLPDVEFGARLAGAIRTTGINGTLTV